MGHNPMVGEVPFPIAGEGFVLRLTLRDLVGLRSKYDRAASTTNENADRFYTPLTEGCFKLDPEIIFDLLHAALKKADGKTKPHEQEFSYDDPPWALSEAQYPLLDAIFARRDGKTFTEQAAERAEALRLGLEEAEKNAANFQTALDTLNESSTQDSAPGSIQSESGISPQ